MAELGGRPHRRLLWAVLTDRTSSSGRAFLVATAHFTWQGAPGWEELPNPRAAQAKKAASTLERLAQEYTAAQPPSDHPAQASIPTIFMGDLNECFAPTRVLSAAGFVDCFTELCMYPKQPTHPQRPCADASEEALPDSVMDWIFSRNPASGAASLRCLLASVVTNAQGRQVQNSPAGSVVWASDHKPVTAVYELS
jgi:endonuclease/exonuclease/phosphatase family metal-dependent hydrolase